MFMNANKINDKKGAKCVFRCTSFKSQKTPFWKWTLECHFLVSLLLKFLSCLPLHTTEGEKQGAVVFVCLWEWMNNFLPLLGRVGVWVCLLSSPGVLSGSNSSSGISYRGLCSFICTGGDDNSVHSESRSNRGRPVFKEKLLRQGIWWWDFSHISHMQHIQIT